MKKVCLTFAVSICLTISASAQFSKGTIFVGPTIGTNSYQSASNNLNYSSGNNSNRTASLNTYTFSMGPQVGKFITDHLVLGASFNYSLTAKDTKTNTTLTNNNLLISDAKTSTSTLSTGPFLRYYYFDKLSRNIFYTQLNATVGTGSGSSSGNGNSNIKSTYESSGSVTGIFTWNAGGSVGVSHFFNDTVAMDIALGYSYTSNSSNNKTSTNTTAEATEIVTTTSNNYHEKVLTHGVTLGLGFHWFFKKQI